MKILLAASVIIMFFGVLFLATGIMFRIMHWPDMWNGTISGPIMVAIGAALMVAYLILKRTSRK